MATLAVTGDLMGVRWRPGPASAARRATEWAEVWAVGGERLTVWLDKGCFNRAMVECLESLGVAYLLKVPDYH